MIVIENKMRRRRGRELNAVPKKKKKEIRMDRFDTFED